MSDEAGWLPGNLLRKLLERVITRRILETVVIPTLADLQHENALVNKESVWRRAFVLTRGYLGVWTALGLCLASWPARSLRKDWLETDAVGPCLLRALAPRAGILGLGLTFLQVGWPGDSWLLLFILPSVITVTGPLAFFLGLVLALGGRGARSSPLSGTRWLSATVGLSVAGGLLTFGLYGWVTPQANQLFRERAFRMRGGPGSEDVLPIPKGRRELTLGELQTRIHVGRKEGKSTVALDVEWHKKWAIPAACLVFGPLAIGLHGLWKRPRPLTNLALALAATFLLYSALRIGEQIALSGRIGPLPAIWAGDVLLALITLWLIARLSPLRGGATIAS